MSLTGDTFDFQQGNVVTSSAQIVDNGATVGDVLTVQADKSIAAAPGGGSLPDDPATCSLVLVGAQEIADGTTGFPLYNVSGPDGIGVTFDADHSKLRVPAGWYELSADFWWAPDATGVRAAFIIKFGEANPVGGVFPGVANSAAEYAALDNLGGQTLGPFLFKTDDFDVLTGFNLRFGVWQTSGNPLNLVAADVLLAKLA